jgi:hypothetical protein
MKVFWFGLVKSMTPAQYGKEQGKADAFANAHDVANACG